ncbi:MAG TPA: SURF1 family protein [Gemmatimonadaceae bacterium]|nr:SURF1 family protein [Gemmatimonadaceae bacterium]
MGILVVLAVAVAAVCIRLGIWQLDRLEEKRAFNANLAKRLASPPVPLSALPTDTGSAHYRRVIVSGTYDYANEIVLTSRVREGSPGVNIITPLRRADNDTAVLVNRGWIYSPDGTTADLQKWREAPAASGTGYVETFVPRDGAIRSPKHPRAYRWLDPAAMKDAFPYPLAPYHVVLVQGSSSDSSRSVPPRLGAPRLSEGAHRSYAIQWFSFAAISIIGMFLFAFRKQSGERQRARREPDGQ